MEVPPNVLYYGDNLHFLQNHEYFPEGLVDLVYLDPPFNSDADYNAFFKERDGSRSAAQMQAFEDTWEWNEVSSLAFSDFIESPDVPDQPKAAMLGFQKLIGDSDMLAYLAMMAPRLFELHRVLKDTGSLYLHCDPTASHYLKLLLDSIFGPENFRNEIVWRRTGSHGPRRSFGPIHDTIFFYSKTPDYYFQVIRRPYMLGHVKTRYKMQPDGRLKFITGGNILTGAGATEGESGMPWKGFDPSRKNRHWAVPGDLAEQMPPDFMQLGTLAKLDALYEAGLVEIKDGAEWPHPVRYLKPGDGQPIADIWASQPYTGKWGKGVEGTVHDSDEDIDADVQWMTRTGPERLDYPTQKTVGLLERIINASCPPDGVVLDPFCGCGTTIDAAHKLKRKWIGIDVTTLATTLIKNRLRSAYGSDVTKAYHVIGEPTTAAEAAMLAKEEPYQFQWWALGLAGARPAKGQKKKGADKGIDGRLYFRDDLRTNEIKQVIFSVKAGENISPAMVRDLIGTVKTAKAAMGVLLLMKNPTTPMTKAAVGGGYYHSPISKHPKIQILTVAELLSGAKLDMPHWERLETFKHAKRVKGKAAETRTIPWAAEEEPEEVPEELDDTGPF